MLPIRGKFNTACVKILPIFPNILAICYENIHMVIEGKKPMNEMMDKMMERMLDN